ncbi:MAG TPA: hypothetical protein VI322_03660 [Candidatus Saccharimonadia bacterium]
MMTRTQIYIRLLLLWIGIQGALVAWGLAFGASREIQIIGVPVIGLVLAWMLNKQLGNKK